jgi:hypothetical protein
MAVLAQPSSVDACREYLRLGYETGFSCNVTQADAASATTIDGAGQYSDGLITVASTANMRVGYFIGLACTGGTVNGVVTEIPSATTVRIKGAKNVPLTDTGAVTIEPIDANGPFTSIFASAAGAVKYVDLYGNLCTATLAASQRLRVGIARVYDTGTTITDANLIGYR